MIRYKLKNLMQIKSLETGSRISYQNIQDDTGISKVTLSKLANNNFNPTGATIEKICKYFDCSLLDFMEMT